MTIDLNSTLRGMTATERAALDAERSKAFCQLEDTLRDFERLTSITEQVIENSMISVPHEGAIVLERADAENISWLIYELGARVRDACEMYRAVGDDVRKGGLRDAA